MSRWIGLTAMLALASFGACGDDDSGTPPDSGDTTETADDVGTPDVYDTPADEAAPPDTPVDVPADTPADMPTDTPSDATPGDPMPDDTRIIYLHHSTGGVIWGGGVPDEVTTYNTANGTTYEITERAYPSGDPYPWANYPYDYWNIWINNEGSATYMEEETLELLTPQYGVIVFKHCFPVSGIEADTGSPDITSETKSLENYHLQYEALKTKMRSFPGNRFLVWTGAALTAANTDADQAARAREFFEWVKNTWDEPGDNIFVWDFFELETAGGNVLLDSNAEAPDNSHPNAAFAARVAPLFVNRLVSVIRGTGDTTSLTGE